MLLRNPVERAYSHYHLERRRGREELSFEEALEREPERLAGEKMISDGRYQSLEHQHLSYLSRGIYLDQLKRWRQYFTGDRFLILKSEDFYLDPPTAVARATGFLGLPGVRLEEYKKYNEAHYSGMDPATRAYLMDYFRPHNERLYEYLGRDFGWDR